jgi:hypothetical protein
MFRKVRKYWNLRERGVGALITLFAAEMDEDMGAAKIVGMYGSVTGSS